MSVLIELNDGRVVTPNEHYCILCERFGLSGTGNIKRDPDNPERWIENEDEYHFVKGSENYDGREIVADLWCERRRYPELIEAVVKFLRGGKL